MGELLVYIDRSEILPGKLEELKGAASELVRFVSEHEPQLISYGIYLDQEASAMTVVAIHPNSASMEFHLAVGAPEFRKVGRHIDLRLIEVFGDPSETVVEQLEQKARTLGKHGHVVRHELVAGFTRFPTDRPG